MKRSREGRSPPLAAAFGASARGQECCSGSHADPLEQQFASSDPECIARGAIRTVHFGRTNSACPGQAATSVAVERGVCRLQVEYSQTGSRLAPRAGSTTILRANVIFRATIPAGREPWIRVGDDPRILLHPLHLAHLPFQTIVAAVVGAIGKSATDPPNNDQSRKAERELVHIELPMMNRRVGWRAVEPIGYFADNILHGLSRAHLNYQNQPIDSYQDAGGHVLPVHYENSSRKSPSRMRFDAPLDNFCGVATLRFERNANARDIGVVVQNIDLA